MKKYCSMLLGAAFTMLLLNSCDKAEQGPEGPMGNADVTVYNYGTQTTSSGLLTYTLTIPKERVDSSLVLVYYNPSNEVANAWYPAPGLGSNAAYETRYVLYQTAITPQSVYTLSVRLANPANAAPHTGSVTFTKLKIVVAPASSILPGGRMAQPFDVNDYYSVKNYFNLED